MVNILYTYISESNHSNLLNEYLAAFPLAFQDKIKRYRRWQDAQLSLLGRVLLRKLLKSEGLNYQELELKYTDYNKPYFENCDWNFNISHSGEIVICVLAKNRSIGIDIELMKDIDLNDFNSQMTNSEWSKIQYSPNKTKAFYQYWCQKEAVIKAHGKGLSIPLKSFEIEDDFTKIENESFYLTEIHLDESYRCFLASDSRFCSDQISMIKTA